MSNFLASTFSASVAGALLIGPLVEEALPGLSSKGKGCAVALLTMLVFEIHYLFCVAWDVGAELKRREAERKAGK